ncbi:MAG: hypothetical protein LCI00_08215 [Chloroflexi bacterium]|nr:hypothetical protein [Chloroflexota bacterium]
MSLESNIFRITNAAALSTKYRLYRIKGLDNAPDEHYQNRQNIIKRLSFTLQSPITIIDREGNYYLVVQTGTKQPSSSMSLTRTTVTFEPYGDEFTLDFGVRSPENDRICIRFLDFWIQGILFGTPDFWLPSAGKPIFGKISEPLADNLVKYTGFAIRAIITPDNTLGICVDITSKTVGLHPLPAHLDREKFATKWKGQTFVYHFGHNWYEIQAVGLSDQTITEYLIPDTQMNLLDYTVEKCRKPIPDELAIVPHDASTLLYLNNRNENLSAIAPLCYPVYRTSHERTGQQHGQTILRPDKRRERIHRFVRESLVNLRLGVTPVELETKPIEVEPRMFVVPDIRFGKNKVLSVRGTPNTQHVSLDLLGQTRLDLLKDKLAGFYTCDSLQRQYLILPQSVADSYGIQLTEDLKRTMGDLFPHDYNPIFVTYNDRIAKTFAKQGNAILEAVNNHCTKPGYAVVMIHHTTDHKEGAEDQLAAMVIRKLYEHDPQIFAAVIHSDVGRECYFQPIGSTSYGVRAERRGKLNGYLRMVAINKVLLTNQQWPFVLDTRLNADLTIGLDVKQHTAGLVIVSSNGGDIQALPPKKSRQKEKLSERQMQAYLVEAIRRAVTDRKKSPKTILLQRDGRVFESEIKGAHAGIALLKKEGILSQDATLTIIEISKSAPVRLRLFDVSLRSSRPWVDNPQIGNYCIINKTEGYLCSTGRAFRHKGTVRPLHVRHIEGPLQIEQCLEDVFYLTCLTWTRPEDCSRNPVTVKLNDRFLSEEATDFDENALDIEAILAEEEEMEEVL